MDRIKVATKELYNCNFLRNPKNAKEALTALDVHRLMRNHTGLWYENLSKASPFYKGLFDTKNKRWLFKEYYYLFRMVLQKREANMPFDFKMLDQLIWLGAHARSQKSDQTRDQAYERGRQFINSKHPSGIEHILRGGGIKPEDITTTMRPEVSDIVARKGNDNDVENEMDAIDDFVNGLE